MHVEAICDLYQEKEPSPHGPEGSTAHLEGNGAQLPWTLLYLWWGGQTLYRETDNGRIWQVQEWPCASNQVWWVESGCEAGGCESSSDHTHWLCIHVVCVVQGCSPALVRVMHTPAGKKKRKVTILSVVNCKTYICLNLSYQLHRNCWCHRGSLLHCQYWTNWSWADTFFVRSWQRPTWPKCPASIVIDSATYWFTICSPDTEIVTIFVIHTYVENGHP